jgi:holo-[acyl-carrier protein] synthase
MSETVEAGDVVSHAREIVSIAEVSRWLASGEAAGAVFTEAEVAYARSKSDPERRLAARLAAKRAACRALAGPGIGPEDVEVVRAAGGPPRLRLSARAEAALRARGAATALVSLTHGRTHAAAAVLLLRGHP